MNGARYGPIAGLAVLAVAIPAAPVSAGLIGGNTSINGAGAGKEGGVYNQINTVPGQTYTITARVKSGSPAAWCFFGINTSGGTDAHESSGTFYPADNGRSTSWQSFSWTGQAVGNKISLFLDTYDGVAYWDTTTP